MMFAKNIASVRSQACGLTEEVIESSSSNLGDDSITTEDSIIKDSISTEDSITNKDSIIKDSITNKDSIIKDSITKDIISDLYFFGSSSLLTEITIPDNITKIGKYAFARLTSLKNILIPNSVKEIGNGA